MKYSLFILPALLIAMSCGTSKDAQSASTGSSTSNETVIEKKVDEDTNQQSTDNGGLGMAEGIVKNLAADGCGFVIEVLMDNVSNESTYFEPLDLPAAYQVDGKPIKFTYRMSRRASKCTQANPIVIDKVME